MIQTVDTQQLQPAPAPLEVAEESGLSFGILLVCYPDERQEIFDLVRATIHVGRAPDNDVILDDDLIAEHHAQILCDNSGCQVLDLGSHIGSQILERSSEEKQPWMSGLRLPPKMPHPLLKGTTVLMGEILLIYYPSTKDIPKAVVAGDSILRRVLRVATFLLLFLIIFGSSTLWVRSWLNRSTSRAESTLTTIPTVVPSPVVTATIAPTPTLVSNIYIVETTFELNLHVRSAPGLDQPILGKLAYGTVVHVWSEPVRVGPYHWVRVDAPNLSGWCIFDGLRPQ